MAGNTAFFSMGLIYNFTGMKRKILQLSPFLIILILIFTGLYNYGRQYYHFDSWNLGTSVQISYHGHFFSRDRIHDNFMNTLEYYEKKYSPYIQTEENIVHRINKAPPGEPVPLDSETYALLQTAVDVSRETSGAFDITVRPLLQLWGLDSKEPVNIPSSEEIEETLSAVGYKFMELADKALIKTAPIEIDLGGIAKGYIIDRLARYLAGYSKSFMVNIGGDIYLHGRNQNKRDGLWSIGLQDPFFRDEMMAIIPLEGSRAVATSGNYERFIEIGGKRYGHIMDPRTGFPVKDNQLSVTVFAPNALIADCYSTAFYVLGPEKTAEIISRYPHLSVLYLYLTGENRLAFFHSAGLVIDFLDPYYVSRETYDEKNNLHTGVLGIMPGVSLPVELQGE